MVRFTRRTEVPCPIEAVFDLALSIDVHTSSFSDAMEQAVAGVTAGRIGLGEFVTWRARHFGRWWTMTSTITELEWPVRFVDEQHRGPFASFWHEHRFVPGVDGAQTEMFDDVRFEAPFGVLGRVAERLVLARYLAHLIDVRNTFIAGEAARR